MVAPEKYGPSVLKRGPKGSFVELRAEYYGTVIKINGHYRMWYLAYGFEDPAVRTYDDVSVHVGYAESPDGIHWTKPSLGLVNYHGGTANNIVDIEPEFYTRINADGNVHVLYDPEDPDPSRLYKMMINVPIVPVGDKAAHWSMMPFLSPDGLRWRYAVPIAVERYSKTGKLGYKESSSILPPEHLEGGSLVRYGGIYYENGQQGTLPDGRRSGRVDSTFWSADFIHWNHEKALSLTRYGSNPVHKNFHLALSADGEQVHEGAALWNRGNVLVGIYGRWEGGNTGLSQSHINLGLVTSVDAIHFTEPDPNFRLRHPWERRRLGLRRGAAGSGVSEHRWQNLRLVRQLESDRFGGQV